MKKKKIKDISFSKKISSRAEDTSAITFDNLLDNPLQTKCQRLLEIPIEDLETRQFDC